MMISKNVNSKDANQYYKKTDLLNWTKGNLQITLFNNLDL